MMDVWDGIGAAGVALVLCGVWRLAGWPWAVVVLGFILISMYVVRELRLARLMGRDK